jgi:hypothetical protein
VLKRSLETSKHCTKSNIQLLLHPTPLQFTTHYTLARDCAQTLAQAFKQLLLLLRTQPSFATYCTSGHSNVARNRKQRMCWSAWFQVGLLSSQHMVRSIGRFWNFGCFESPRKMFQSFGLHVMFRKGEDWRTRRDEAQSICKQNGLAAHSCLQAMCFGLHVMFRKGEDLQTRRDEAQSICKQNGQTCSPLMPAGHVTGHLCPHYVSTHKVTLICVYRYEREAMHACRLLENCSCAQTL